MELIDSKTLFFKDRRSDKKYCVELQKIGVDEYNVIAFFGPRTGAQQATVKTKTPVPLVKARSVFDQTIREKEAKGYQPGEDSTRYVAPADPSSDYGYGLPSHMLLTEIKRAPEIASFLYSDPWLLQPKHDGDRIRVTREGDKVWAVSKNNKPHALPLSVIQAAKKTRNNFVADGELVEDTYIVFDVLLDGALSIWRERADFRAGYLAAMFAGLSPDIIPTITAITRGEKSALYEKIHSTGVEGVVFKLKSAPYEAGRSDNALKYKFINTASAIVASYNSDVDSVNVTLFGGRDMGSVTMIGKPHPPVGSVCEVAYLYVHDVGGKFIQPRFLHVRHDVEPEECTADQLRVKGAAR